MIRVSAHWSPAEWEVIERMTNAQGEILQSRPKDDGTHYARWAYYVWRMVAWTISNEPPHVCMPVLAYMDTNASEIPALDELVDKIVGLIPKSEWKGIQRWARVL